MAGIVIRARRQPRLRIGPQHDGRRMSFRRFQRAETVEGYLYELSNGVIEVTDVPGRSHALVVREIEKQLFAFDLANPNVILHLAGVGFAKTDLPGELPRGADHQGVVATVRDVQLDFFGELRHWLPPWLPRSILLPLPALRHTA